MFGLEIVDHAFSLSGKLCHLLIPEGVEVSKLVSVGSLEVVVLLGVSLLHLVHPSCFQIATKLFRSESLSLSLYVIAVLLVLMHL